MVKKKIEKIVEVGWCVDSPLSNVVFSEPKTVQELRKAPLSRRAVQACPAVNEFERRLIILNSGFDIRLRIEKNKENCELFVIPEGTRIDDDLVQKFVSLNSPEIWRDNKKPVIQILLPYFFVCDQLCYISQIYPFLNYKANLWPGTLVGGRFPITNWPRILNFAFEWIEDDKDLIIKRGDPLCYIFFEFDDPTKIPKLIRAKMTPELVEFKKEIDATPEFVSSTFSLMDEAAKRRPKKLLKKI